MLCGKVLVAVMEKGGDNTNMLAGLASLKVDEELPHIRHSMFQLASKCTCCCQAAAEANSGAGGTSLIICNKG